jgi:hypothetical protein
MEPPLDNGFAVIDRRLYQGKRRVTSEEGGVAEPHRRMMMSRTISRLSAITSIVVTMLR